MKNTYTIKIAGNDYLFRVSKDENGIFIEFKRNDKLQSSTYLPLENEDQLKMILSEKLMIMALYDINHFVKDIYTPTPTNT